MLCRKCKKKKSCKEPCNKLSFMLKKIDSISINSNYIIKFFDPSVIDRMKISSRNMNVTEQNEDDEYINYFEIISKSMLVLNDIERYYVISYYGLSTNKYINSQLVLAKERKVSQHTVWYHLKKARRKLKKEILRLLLLRHI